MSADETPSLPKRPCWIDAHAHLADPRAEGSLAEWIRAAEAQGIGHWIQGGVGPEDWDAQVELAKKYPARLSLCFGLHPWWVAAHPNAACEAAYSLLESRMASRPRGLVAWGEMGLDHHERFSQDTYERQARFFERQWQDARGAGMPAVLHVVRAHEPALRILEAPARAGDVSRPAGIIHSFSGDLSFARRYLRLGLVPSLSCAVLSRGKGKAFETLLRTVLDLTLDEFVLETDSPDQPPAGHAGELNPPTSLLDLAVRIGEWKGVDTSEVLDRSSATLRKIFGVNA